MLKYPCLRSFSWEIWENSINGVVKHNIVVKFTDRTNGEIVSSTDKRYPVGKVAEFISATNKIWSTPK